MNDFTFGAIAGGLIGAAWAKVQQVFTWITGLLIVRVELDSEDLAKALEWYCWSRCKHTRSPFYTFDTVRTWVRSLDKHEMVIVEYGGGRAQLFWTGWRPLFFTGKAQQAHTPQTIQSSSAGMANIRISFIRGTFNADQLVQQALAAFVTHIHGQTPDALTRFQVIRCTGTGSVHSSPRDGRGPEANPASAPRLPQGRIIHGRILGFTQADIGDPLPIGGPLDRLALSPVASTAVDDVRRWAKSREWYRQHQIAWRRGMLLHGMPGTGKSSVVRGIAQELDWPVCVFDLATMSNRDLNDFWRTALGMSPCVVLIEDIDAVFNGRTNTLGDMGGGLTFDALLNTLSGVEQSDGILVVLTTNNRQTLDPALAGGLDNTPSRPGRVDIVVEMGAPDLQGRQLIAHNILPDHPLLADRLAEVNTGMSGAQFQELCIAEALTQFWKRS